MFSKRKPTSHSVKRTVTEDWIAALPRDKSQLFDKVVHRWESSYAMASVSLNDALTLRSRGELVAARMQVAISAQLMERIAQLLIGTCCSISDRGRHISDVPQVLPLNTEYFRGQTAQSAASWNEFLHHVLFADRSRFFQKLRILSETLESLVREFAADIDDLSAAQSVHPNDCWKLLEIHHYDFNTCLREAEVLLKSFLRVLPPEQVGAFAEEMEVTAAGEKPRKTARPRLNILQKQRSASI